MNPTEIALETIRRLASSRTAPIPENYARVYAAISGQPLNSPARQIVHKWLLTMRRVEAIERDLDNALKYLQEEDWYSAQSAFERLFNRLRHEQSLDWAGLIKELFREWDTPREGLNSQRKKENLDHVLAVFANDPVKLYPRIKSLATAWSSYDVAKEGTKAHDTASRLGATRTDINRMAEAGLLLDMPAHTHSALKQSSNENHHLEFSVEQALRTLLINLFNGSIAQGLPQAAELGYEAAQLAELAKRSKTKAEFEFLADQSIHYWMQLKNSTDTLDITLRGLRGLLRLMVMNLADLVDDDSWVQGQVLHIDKLLESDCSAESLEAAEHTFRDLVNRQAAVRKSLSQAKHVLKEMVGAFIDRLGLAVESTDAFSGRLQQYSEQVESAEDINSLSDVIKELMQDTKGMQQNLRKTRDELKEVRERAAKYENQIRTLQSDLEVLSTSVKEDYLTQTLNRRGLEQSMKAEFSRNDRSGLPLCLALLDIDNFKQLNDTFGHNVGDDALKFLVNSVRKGLRPSDVIARWGGEEFVILLPDTPLKRAAEVMTRLQRTLTAQFFLQNSERVFVTFSAGVAQRQSGESQASLIARADTAMFNAKRTGKNRVVTSE